MAHITLKADATSTISDRITDVKTEIINKIDEEIIPKIDTNKSEIEKVNSVLNNDVLPIVDEFASLYEIIIINILLSKFMIFLNHIFKWYSYKISNIDNNDVGITYIILLSEINQKNIYNSRHKEFKNKLKELKKEYGITYKELVDNTVSYIKNSHNK